MRGRMAEPFCIGVQKKQSREIESFNPTYKPVPKSAEEELVEAIQEAASFISNPDKRIALDIALDRFRKEKASTEILF